MSKHTKSKNAKRSPRLPRAANPDVRDGASFRDRIQALLPAARQILSYGPDPNTRGDLSNHIPGVEPCELSDAQAAQMVAWTEMHYFVGIAVGLLLNASTFLQTGGE